MKTLSRGNQKIAGLFVFLLSAAFIAWSWHTVLTEGYYYPKTAVIFPAFAVFGLAIIIFPNYTDERIARGEDVSGLKGLKIVTVRWWIISAVAMGIGFINLWFISR